MELNVNNQQVVGMDFSDGVSITTESGAVIAIRNNFGVKLDRVHASLDIEDAQQFSGLLVKLMNTTIVDASVRPSGLLVMQFSDGSEIVVQPSEDEFPWVISNASTDMPKQQVSA